LTFLVPGFYAPEMVLVENLSSPSVEKMERVALQTRLKSVPFNSVLPIQSSSGGAARRGRSDDPLE